MENKDFITTVNAEMGELKARAISTKGDQFAVWFITKILKEEEGVAVEQYHVGGAGDNKLDIGICDEEHEVIIIGQCKYSTKPQETTYSMDLPEEAKNAKDRLIQFPEEGNEKRKAFAGDFKRSDKPQKIIAVGFGKVSKDAFKYANENNIEIYDFEKIKKRYIYNEVYPKLTKPELEELEIAPNGIIEEIISEVNVKQWAFLLPIKEVYRLIDKYGDGIFEQNLRYKLEKSAKSGINKEIFETVVSRNKAFAALNNGLTIVAKKAEPGEESTICVHEPQIINGCQTCWAIYDAVEQLEKGGDNAEKINGIKVFVKVVETKDSPFIEQIRLTTNRQNPIGWKDIRSKDDWQHDFHFGFKSHEPPIFYEFRDGHWGAIVREDEQSVFAIKGKKYRKITNEMAGQLYLAMLGKPYLSKQSKKEILANDDFYNVIFDYRSDRSIRFENKTLNLNPKAVYLESGLDNFIDDVLFAYGIFQLAEALKAIYKTKRTDFIKPETEGERILREEMSFLNNWHYLLIALINDIVAKWAKIKGTDRNELNERLLGKDWNIIFAGNLKQYFNINTDEERATIIDEDEPSESFELFSIWVLRLIDKLTDMVSEAIKTGDFNSTRWFIDQKPETYTTLKKWIERIYGKSKRSWAESFPKEI